MASTTTDARREQILADPQGPDLARHLIEFDPDAPSDHLFASASFQSRAALTPIPWPAGLEPHDVEPSGTVSMDSPLPRADVLVVTWTVAEAKALADVLTPGRPSEAWQPYRHLFDEVYAPLIRKGAPAQQSNRLGLYAQCQIGQRRVLCMKSELHLSQDGPHLPVRTLWKQIVSETGAKLVISTGTAGGIGSQTQLGDVIVTRSVQFDCRRTFKNASFAQTLFGDPGGTLPGLARLTQANESLLGANADRLPPAARAPRILHGTEGAPATVLTTDFFAFDDAGDSYGLRSYNPRARAVEMGDAVLGLACAQDIPDPPRWAIVRNASDPQIDGSGDLREQAAEAAHIYEQYGFWTTVGSAIACWALIAD